MNNELDERNKFIMYTTDDGQVDIEVRLEDENVWLTQNSMAGLFDTTKQNISLHIKNIFEEKELEENSVVKECLTTAKDGKNYKTKFYNLDLIISVGYRVRSVRGTQFRIWANKLIKEYLIKGYNINVKRFKNNGGGTYFEEVLEKIRDIRSSEKVFWRKILDIYATSVDYDAKSEQTREFFKTVQNKMHYAIHGHTAAEHILERADHQKQNMGLMTWQDAPNGKIKKSDVIIAKNYLSEFELSQLNRMVTSYLDFAENMAQRKIPLTMQDRETRLNGFIEMFEYGLLKDAGKVTAAIAKIHAETEFEKYRIIQDQLYMSDFDRYLLELEEKMK